MKKARDASTCFSVEDRISRLPDNLIHHIMSFMDTTYGVQTSVLSKRWIDTWKSLPVLNFDRSSFSDGNNGTEKFIEFVYMVFMFREDTSIQKFNVDWESSSSDNRVIRNVNRWSLNAVRRDVQEVSIIIDHRRCNPAYEIPHQLLNCESVRKMGIDLYGNSTYVDIILPISMNLPKLKELILEGLAISDVEVYKKFISSCPVLETLTIVDCDIKTDNGRNFIVDSASLKNFQYTCWLNYSTMPSFIKLCAPNLKVFIFRSFLTHDYSLENSSPLSTVRFDMFIEETEEDENAETYSKLPSTVKDVYAKRMMKLLGAVSRVKDMTLSSGFLECLSQAPELLDCKPPRLRKLRTLLLDLWSTRSCLRAIAYLFKISPHLTNLTLTYRKSNLGNVGDDWEAGLSLPGILSHLEYVKIEEMEGCDDELKLLGFLLKNAKVLKEVALYFRSSVGSHQRVRQVGHFGRKLGELPTASSNIKMMLL